MGNAQSERLKNGDGIVIGGRPFDHHQLEPEGTLGADNYLDSTMIVLTYTALIKYGKPSNGRALRDACLRGDIRRVKEAIEVHNVDINGQGTDLLCYTPILIAVAFCHYDIFMYLLEKGADIRKTNFYSETVLFRAVMWNRADIVKHLTARPDMDVTIVNVNNRTALTRAIEDGFTECARLILNCAQFKDKPEELKSFINRHWYRHGTVFYTASYSGRLDILQLLEDAGADPYLQDNIPITQKAPTEIPSRRPAKRVRSYLEWLKLDINDPNYLTAVTAHSNHLWIAMSERTVFSSRSQELLRRYPSELQDARDSQGNSLLHRNAFKGSSMRLCDSLTVYALVFPTVCLSVCLSV